MPFGSRRFRLGQRDVMECRRDDDRPHSGLMLAARITLPHFSVSSAMSLPKSAGEPGRTVPPRSPNRAFILGSAITAVEYYRLHATPVAPHARTTPAHSAPPHHRPDIAATSAGNAFPTLRQEMPAENNRELGAVPDMPRPPGIYAERPWGRTAGLHRFHSSLAKLTAKSALRSRVQIGVLRGMAPPA
jgi:hypothetical protein